MTIKALIIACMCIFASNVWSNTSSTCQYSNEERLTALQEVLRSIPKTKSSNWLQAFDPLLASTLPNAIADDGLFILGEKSLIVNSCISGFNKCGAIESLCKIEFSGKNAECVKSVCIQS
jgi:hypothetical protein